MASDSWARAPGERHCKCEISDGLLRAPSSIHAVQYHVKINGPIRRYPNGEAVDELDLQFQGDRHSSTISTARQARRVGSLGTPGSLTEAVLPIGRQSVTHGAPPWQPWLHT